jgi:phenylacetic acid degradation protein paaN
VACKYNILMSNQLFVKHENLLKEAIKALYHRTYFTPYPESPKMYDLDIAEKSKTYVASILNSDFNELLQTKTTDKFVGEEISPFLQVGMGIRYPKPEISKTVELAGLAMKRWNKLSVNERTGLLIETLDNIKLRFFDIAYATMHTTGQSFMMSFQASGPHSNDRALEAIAVAYSELTKYIENATWIKPMGKFDLSIRKNWKAIPKGINLTIGCSTFPIWNSVPAIFASLMTGNSCIVKPHPKAILPIAIVVAEIQKVLVANNQDANLIQLAVDTVNDPITKDLAEHSNVKLIDFTGSSAFGNYIEKLDGKTVFTEKAGVNSIIIDSVLDMNAVAGNIAFSACLYSGQMCTAPQNIFIPEKGISTSEGMMTYDDCVAVIVKAVDDLTNNPKAGAATLGAIQTDETLKRIKTIEQKGQRLLLASKAIINEEFPDARTLAPAIVELTSSNRELFCEECFGPVLFIIKTADTKESIELAMGLAIEKGALTCSAYSVDESCIDLIESKMNSIFVPVSFNFTGAAFINSHAAFSDLHVTGGNAAGNASLTNTEYIAKRFVWVGNRYC